MYEYVFAWVYVSASVREMPEETKEGIAFPESGITEVVKSNVVVESCTWFPHKNEQSLLTTESSLQPQEFSILTAEHSSLLNCGVHSPHYACSSTQKFSFGFSEILIWDIWGDFFAGKEIHNFTALWSL